MSSVEDAGTMPDRSMDGRALGSSYVLETVIGRGATGEVWRGRVRETDEPVAAKVLDSALTRDPRIVARFVHERALLTQVVHPNVVAVRDLVVEGDTLAIVTDLVAGSDLRTRLDRSGPFAPDVALAVIDQVLLGVGAIHARGLVHRDLKAANVLLEEDEPGARRARIVDFGIAHLTTADGPDEHGALVGSPEYLAPELLDGGAATPASDLYAVGIILCELVTGRTPFAADHSTVVLQRHLDETPARPPEMPADLWHRVEPFLAKDPARRPATADAGRHLLAISSPESGVDRDATIVPSAPAARRPPAPSHTRHRRRWVGAVAVLAVVAVAVGALVLSRSSAPTGASLASAPEYLPDAGKPVVQRRLAIDGRDLRVRIRVTAVPVDGLTLTERIPPLVRRGRVMVDGRVAHPRADGALRLHVPYRATTESTVEYRIALDADRTSAFLRRYERARVRGLRNVPAPDRPDTLVALEVAPAVRIKVHQRAWLPVSGRTLAGATDTTVAESLGRSWAWTSSNPHVATVVRAHPHAAAAGRAPDANAFRIDAISPGSTVVSTVVAGVRYAVTVTVAGHAQSAVACDPGVFPGSRLQLATNGESTHPVEGTLVGIGTAGTPAARAVGGRLVPLSGNDAPCAGASVVRLTLGDYGRLVAGGAR